MINHRRNYQLIAWAWGAGWLLVSMGMAISGVYSSPNSGLTAAYVLGFAGWTIGAAVTIHYVRQQFGKNVYLTGLSIAGWAVGAFVAVVTWAVMAAHLGCRLLGSNRGYRYRGRHWRRPHAPVAVTIFSDSHRGENLVGCD